MNWGKLFEVVQDAVSLVLDAVALATSDPKLGGDWDELLSDLQSLGLFEPASASPPATAQADEPLDQPFVAADGSLWPTEREALLAGGDVKASPTQVVRRISKKGQGS